MSAVQKAYLIVVDAFLDAPLSDLSLYRYSPDRSVWLELHINGVIEYRILRTASMYTLYDKHSSERCVLALDTLRRQKLDILIGKLLYQYELKAANKLLKPLGRTIDKIPECGKVIPVDRNYQPISEEQQELDRIKRDTRSRLAKFFSALMFWRK